jgi:cytochrome P450 family 6
MRKCVNDYRIPNTKLVIPSNTVLIIPSFAIQRDSDIYSDPTKFDPERFTDENMASRHTMANLAFGDGPRVILFLILNLKD